MEVLSGTDISSEVLRLIEGAKEFLVLVSPYFDPWDRLSTEIKRAKTRQGLKVRMLLRGGEDRQKQEAKARDMEAFGVEVQYLNRLHAKVYISDSQAIVTSMNLLKSSAMDSWEIAMRADRIKDAVAYADILKHTSELIKRAHDEQLIAVQPQVNSGIQAFASMLAAPPVKASAPALTPPRPSPPAAGRPPSPATPARPVVPPAFAAAMKKSDAARKQQTGFCIRCAAGLAFNVEHVYCSDCYKSWVKYKNTEYEEKYCHGCGKAETTSMVKPLCRPCWKAQNGGGPTVW